MSEQKTKDDKPVVVGDKFYTVSSGFGQYSHVYTPYTVVKVHKFYAVAKSEHHEIRFNLNRFNITGGVSYQTVERATPEMNEKVSSYERERDLYRRAKLLISKFADQRYVSTIQEIFTADEIEAMIERFKTNESKEKSAGR